MRTLAIFDFDDTLFKSGARVIVKTQNGVDKFLSTHEYSLYKSEPGEVFDFSEFDGFPPSPVEIKPVVKEFIKLVKKLGADNVIILTARAKSAPVLEVLELFKLPTVEIGAVGSSNSEAKSSFVKNKIHDHGYERIILYEDNEKNIEAICKVVESEMGSTGKIDSFKVVNGNDVIRVTKFQRDAEFSLHFHH